MSEQTVGIAFDGNIDSLLSALRVAKSAIDDAFNLDRVTSEERRKPLGDLFRTMESASDRAINGMIRGTQTWQAALLNIATSLEVRFAQLAAHKLLNWVQAELAMTASTQTNNALRTASDTEAGATGLAAKAQHAVSSILNDAKEVFSGIFAFFAPVMGPAASGPAAAGSASVAALASSVLYAETGAWHIPGNTFAYLHAGEMVVPQPFADSLRAGAGLGGGDFYSITVNAIDTQSGAQFLKNNAAHIAAAISGQVRNFSRAVPAWKA